MVKVAIREATPLWFAAYEGARFAKVDSMWVWSSDRILAVLWYPATLLWGPGHILPGERAKKLSDPSPMASFRSDC